MGSAYSPAVLREAHTIRIEHPSDRARAATNVDDALHRALRLLQQLLERVCQDRGPSGVRVEALAHLLAQVAGLRTTDRRIVDEHVETAVLLFDLSSGSIDRIVVRHV